MAVIKDQSALFEVLNAKKMSAAEIAASFVLLAQFDQLIGPDHSYLVGPRGSGKTTLMRMLQGECLSLWDHRRAAEYRNRIRYSAVFLPADRLWASQVEQEQLSDYGDLLGVSAFATQALNALVETLQYRLSYFPSPSKLVHLPAVLRHRDEVELVGECAKSWQLDLRTPSLNGLATALDRRLSTIADLIESVGSSATRLELLADYPWLAVSPVPAFQFGIRTMNRYTRQPHHRWALLLDEMELAPPVVHKALRAAMRGSSTNLSLKLSFSPFDRYVTSRVSAGDAAPDHDYRPIYLWYGNRSGSRRFVSGIWRRLSSEIVGDFRAPVRVLGPSQIDVSGHAWRDEDYGPESKQYRLIVEMSRKDIGFNEYLLRKNIDIKDFKSLSYERKSATLRKVYPLLVFRDALMEFGSEGWSRRSRKKLPEVFTGDDAVFAALEGNPRWMKAVFTRLLSTYDGHRRVEPGAQYDILRDAADRFEALLRVLPSNADTSTFAVLDLVDTIAKYFYARATGPFSSEAVTTFVVDDDTPNEVAASLETALAAGAVVHLRAPKSPPVLASLTGERFRLAYLLCIRDHMEVPMRLGKSVELSRILKQQVEQGEVENNLRAAIISSPTLPFEVL